MQNQSYFDDPFAFKYVPCEEADQEVDVQSAFKSVVTDNLAFTFTSALGTVMKRQDQTPRFIEFFYNTGAIAFKKDAEDLKPTKTILAGSIKDVRMLNDQQD
jgi:hypothetical protein